MGFLNFGRINETEEEKREREKLEEQKKEEERLKKLEEIRKEEQRKIEENNNRREKMLENIKNIYGLRDIDDVDLRTIIEIENNSGKGLRMMQIGSSNETRLLSAQLETLEYQNWLIIKLLEEIKLNTDKK